MRISVLILGFEGLSDRRAQLYSVTEIAPKSPSLCEQKPLTSVVILPA